MKRKEGAAAGGGGGNNYGQAVLYRGVGGGIAIHHEGGGGGGGGNALNSSSASPQPFHRFSRHTLSSCPGPSAFYASSLAPCDQPQRRTTAATKGGEDPPSPPNVDTKAASLPPHWQVGEEDEEEAEEEEAFREEEEWSAAKRLFVAMLAVLALLGCFLLAAVFAHGLNPLLGYSTSCANTVEGREYMADERGTLCRRSQMDWSTGCCRMKQGEQVNEGEDEAGDGVGGESQEEYVSPCHSCNMTHHCCSIYEACVSCCMQPQHENLLQAAKEHHQGNVWGPSATINPSEQSVFDFCRHRCRTHSGTLHPSANRYRSPLKHCFGLSSSPSLTSSSIPSPPTDFASPSSPSPPLPSTQQDNIPIFAAKETAFKVEKNEQQQLRTPSEERQEESFEDDDEGEKEKRTRGGRNIHRSKRRYVDKERTKEFAEGAEQTQKNEEEEQREERERENEQKEKPKPHQEEETQREIEKEEIDMELEEEPNEEEIVEDDEEIEEEEEEDDDKVEEQVEVKRTSIPLPLGWWWTWTSQLNVTSSSSVPSSAAPLHRFILPSSNSLLLCLFMIICGFLFL